MQSAHSPIADIIVSPFAVPMADAKALEKKEIQPENQGAWANATKDLLNNARAVTDELLAALKDRDIVPPHAGKCVAPYVNPGPRNKADLDAKLSVTRFAANSVDGAIQRVSECSIRLRHEQQKKWAPLKVCEWRLALRSRRPARESFRDHVQDALEKEQQSLLEARIRLTEIADEGKVILEDCEENKARLVSNVQRMVMLGTCKLPAIAYPDNSGSPPSPSSPSSPPPEAAAGEGEDGSQLQKSSKPVVPSDPEGLLLRAPKLDEIVWNYVKKGENVVLLQRTKCERALEVVMQCFKKRWAENEALKKSLEQQVREMDEAIASSEKSLARMKKRIDHFAEVELQPKYDAAQAILVKLRESKAQLEDDFHHKLVALKIDECCRKITPERTGVPPESVPVASILESPKNRKKQMPRNNSSPAFAANSVRPASPAGASSPLKAAAVASIA